MWTSSRNLPFAILSTLRGGGVDTAEVFVACPEVNPWGRLNAKMTSNRSYLSNLRSTALA